MKDFFDQVQRAADAGLYYVALFGALTIPDICGASESQNGKAHFSKYKAWFDKHMGPTYLPFLSGADCYYFRCSMLHQGTSQHSASSYSRVLFIEPSVKNIVMHRNIMSDALNIDVGVFCADMVACALRWLGAVQGSEPFETNKKRFMTRYPNGLPPYIVGVPVIS